MSNQVILKLVGSVSLLACTATGFGLELGTAFHHVVSPTSFSPVLHHIDANVASSSTLVSTVNTIGQASSDLLSQYKHSLASYPLQTKMITGGTLAVVGDAIAQSSANNSNEDEDAYDKLRALSFMVFDMSYRSVQHIAFPIIVQQCRGQYLGAIASAFPPLLAHSMTVSAGAVHDVTYYLAAMEQTLASQLGIVPFLYYPVFFTLTGFVQGLTPHQSIDRAKENFLPLMKRNLLFWIPVQFIQFGFIEEGLQIPFLSICGLAWTFILSAMAGSTKSYGKAHSAQPDEHPVESYCINGNEMDCEIDPKHLFPGLFEEDVDEIGMATEKIPNLETVEDDDLVLR
eukprot:scaffold10708_cov50-Attheya_sp.AAC.1